MSEAREHLIYEARAVRTRKKRDEREIYQDSLINFMERAWSEIEPGEIDINWHHHEIAAALEDITWGRNRELIINIPPRCTKSLLCNVFWPAWTWAQEQDSDYPLAGPQVRFYCLSYGAKLATDIALKMSRLVTGVWYQGMWGDRVKIRDDQKARDNFGNTAGGERISNSIEGGLLGRGGDIQICFPYEEVVWTERGPIRIGEVVENRLALRCWSFNHNISQFELRPIIGWHSNPGRRLVRIVTDHGDLTCTEDHRILTMRGYVAARDLRSCDFIYSAIGLPDLTYRGSADAMPGRNLSYSSDIIYNCPDDVGSNPRCPSAAGIAYQAQMFPSAPRADRPNYSKADIVAFGKYAATFGASRNFSHLMFGQMRGPISEAAMGLTIGDILGSRPVFEPAKRSFSAVTVDMANFLSNWAWAEKSQRYEAMDLAIEMLSIPGQSHSRVPVDDRTSHDFTGHSNIPCAAANSRQASNPAEIRNLISREPVDRQPSFLRVGRVEFVHDIPSNTYCLTIEHNHNMVMGQANICASNCDDPHHLKGAESDTQRKETIEGMRSLSTRVTDPRIFARVLIMQRLHTDDATNYGLENWRRPRHICYPMRFNEQIAHMQPTDPRQLDGELLWPRVWDEEAVAAEERELGNYGCTPAEAPVLMADLSLRPIANVKRGDEVVGFDTHHSSTAPQPNGRPDRRKLKRSTVLEVFKYPKAAIFKLTMRSGAVIRCTKDHLWYRKGKGPDRPTYAMPKVGRKLGRICDSALADIISCEDLRDAGWLGGFFDGEGTVSLCHKEAVGLGFRTSAQIHFYQRAGENLPNCENLERILTKFGFAFRVSKDERKPNKDAPCYEYRIYTLTGHDVSLTQRFLHIAQPIKWRERLIDSVYGAKFIREWDEIVSIEPDGIDDVYALKTTTGNYVVWGYASSNSSGQLQQAPVPRGGGIIQRNWWRLWPEDAPESAGMEAGYRCPVCKWAGFVRAADADGIACPSCGSLATKEVPFPQFSFRLLSVDTNLGEKEQDSWSAATSWEIWHGKNDAPRAMLTYAWRGRPHLHVTKEEAARGEMGLVERIHHIANLRKSDVVLIEKKTRGIDLFNELAMQAVEWPYRLEWFDPTGRGDKVYRLNAVSGLFTADLIWAPNKAWADTVITEVCEQPRAQFSDLADTCSMALIYLRQSLLLPTDEEHAREERRANLFRGNQPSIAQQIEG